jgi:molybdopterin molybdotransferase
MMSVSDAVMRLREQARCLCDVETIALTSASGRVLASDLISPIDVPPSDNSAVDGYALRLADAGQTLAVSLRVAAGTLPAPLPANSVARIFTGASVPQGADAVVMQEDCTSTTQGVTLPTAVRAGENIRRRGQDVAAGAQVLSAGTVLTPWHLGLIASLGLAKVPVRSRLRVALLTTGSELQMPGDEPLPGKIFNSNGTLLTTLLQQLGCEVLDIGVVEDGAAATRAALQHAADHAAVVISTGGVSVGEEDHVRDAVAALGQIDLWKVAIKPGKPFAFGHLGDSLFLGLPGNPASVLVTFLLLVKPLLDICRGAHTSPPCWHSLPSGFSVSKPGKREEYLRVRVNADGVLEAHPNQSSGMLSSACWADGLAKIPAGTTVLAGESVVFLPFSRLLD